MYSSWQESTKYEQRLAIIWKVIKLVAYLGRENNAWLTWKVEFNKNRVVIELFKLLRKIVTFKFKIPVFFREQLFEIYINLIIARRSNPEKTSQLWQLSQSFKLF